MHYKLVLSETQAHALVEACDVYVQMHRGQLQQAVLAILEQHSVRSGVFNSVLSLTRVAGQLFTGFGPGASHSIGSPEVPESARSAAGIYDAIRSKLDVVPMFVSERGETPPKCTKIE